jgi:hypothetical protein
MNSWRHLAVVVVGLVLAGCSTGQALPGPTSPSTSTTTSTRPSHRVATPRFTVTVNGRAAVTLRSGASATLAESGLPVTATGTLVFSSSTGTALCTTDLSPPSCLTSASLPPGIYPGIHAGYSGDGTYSPSTSLNTVGLTVQRSSSTVTCTKVTGTVATVFRLGKCTPATVNDVVAVAPPSALHAGGVLLWRTSGQTTVVTLTSVLRSPGACPTGSTEQDTVGTVTGGTSTYTRLYDPVRWKLCIAASGAFSLVAGTSAQL